MARSSTKPLQSQARESPTDAVAILQRDHVAIRDLFTRYTVLAEGPTSADELKGALAAEICLALAVHARLEEEIFYPAIQGKVSDNLILAATVEHNSAKELVAQLEMMAAGDEYFDAVVWVLGEYVQHHFREEEERIFPAIRTRAVDTVAVGLLLMERKADMTAAMRESVPEIQPGALSATGLVEAEKAAALDEDDD